MPNNTPPRTPTQGQGNANRAQDAQGLVDQATDAVRQAAGSATDLAQDAYETGSRYVRQGLDSLPDVDRYTSVVRRPVEENPMVAMIVAGAVGYLVAYLIHGTSYLSGDDTVPDYARRRTRYGR